MKFLNCFYAQGISLTPYAQELARANLPNIVYTIGLPYCQAFLEKIFIFLYFYRNDQKNILLIWIFGEFAEISLVFHKFDKKHLHF